MNTSPLILMVVTQVSVTAATLYFFYRVLTSKKKVEPDSYADNVS